ncbi:MAG: hypothetical protein K2X44_01830 [Magnetospirillum sp.]|nr:hypothetical protein [Magnetospirillum sp.]
MLLVFPQTIAMFAVCSGPGNDGKGGANMTAVSTQQVRQRIRLYRNIATSRRQSAEKAVTESATTNDPMYKDILLRMSKSDIQIAESIDADCAALEAQFPSA